MNNAAGGALFRSALQLQNQTATRKTVVHVTGLTGPTMNCINGLLSRLIMSVTSQPTLARKNEALQTQRTAASQIPVKVSERVRLASEPRELEPFDDA